MVDRLRSVSGTFSVAILLRTLFDPWKRIYTRSSGIIEYLKAFADNAVSRFVGFWVRIVVLLTALIVGLATVVVGGLVVMAWPFLPLMAIGLIIYGLVP